MFVFVFIFCLCVFLCVFCQFFGRFSLTLVVLIFFGFWAFFAMGPKKVVFLTGKKFSQKSVLKTPNSELGVKNVKELEFVR